MKHETAPILCMSFTQIIIQFITYEMNKKINIDLIKIVIMDMNTFGNWIRAIKSSS